MIIIQMHCLFHLFYCKICLFAVEDPPGLIDLAVWQILLVLGMGSSGRTGFGVTACVWILCVSEGEVSCVLCTLIITYIQIISLISIYCGSSDLLFLSQRLGFFIIWIIPNFTFFPPYFEFGKDSDFEQDPEY